jgi:hypothetical protein
MARSVEVRINSRLRYWQKLLLLKEWKITLTVGALDSGERADCDAKPEYLEATIRIDPALVPEEEWDGFFSHELIHCWTWPLEKLAEFWAGEDENKHELVRDRAEEVATNLERVLLNVTGRKRG